MQVAQQEAEGVAHLAIVVGDTLHQVFAGRRHLRGSRPKRPTGARSRRQGASRYRPDRRRCRAIWTWRGPCSSSVQPGWPTTLIRRDVAQCPRAEQGGVEPAAILVAALEVEIRRPRAARARRSSTAASWRRNRTTRRECPSLSSELSCRRSARHFVPAEKRSSPRARHTRHRRPASANSSTTCCD